MAGGRDFARESVRRTFLFYVADEDRFSAQQRRERLPTHFRTHAVKDLGALLFERLGDKPSDAFAIGDAEDQKGFAGNLEKIAHALGAPAGVVQATVKSTVSTRFSALFTLPLIMVKPPSDSFFFTSMTMVSPG